MDKLEIYNEREKKSYEIDLKPDNSVSLQLKSNLFSPIDKITLNHSFTITAPDTLQNRRAFGVGNQVAADSEQVRMKFPCKFYRNGVLLFNGTCHVQSIENGSFSLLLVWGLDCLEALKDGGDLEDLDLGNMTFTEAESRTNGLPVPHYNTYAECMEMVMFHAHSNGDFAEKNEYHLSATDQFTPCIAARTIFKKCLESAGIAYEVDEAAFEFMKSLAIPLPTLDTGLLEISVNGVGHASEQTYLPLPNNVQTPGCYITGFSTHVPNVTIVDGSRFTVDSACDIKISYDVIFSADEILGFMSLRLLIVQYDESGKETHRDYKVPEYTRVSTTGGALVYHIENFEIEFEGKGEFSFIVFGVETTLNSIVVKMLTAEFNDPPITAGMELSIAANLPKLSKINYVKALCQICGVFPVPPLDGSKVVRFVTPYVLEANKEKAVDWSQYVNGEPKKINFAFSDFAQNNQIAYKDGEKYAASFPMESPTADKEKTAIELPFMHLVGGRWPLWSVEYDEEKKVYEWSSESVDPAIYCLRPSGQSEDTEAYLSFDELTPPMILKRWQPLADAVKRAKVVQVELLLPQIVVKYVDYSVPVYIEQFGGYFGIVSLTNSGSKTTAELIKI